MIYFQKLFDDFKIEYKIEDKSGTWINSNCPHCNDKTYNGGFNQKDEFFNCWRCGFHNLYETLSKILNISEKQIYSLVWNYKTSKSNIIENRKTKIKKLELPNSNFTKNERKYLINRNFNPDLLHDKYKICGGGITGKWAFRIIIPLLLNGKVVSWTARSILSKIEIKKLNIPRYKNLSIDESIISPKSTFYNLDNCHKKEVILTEGAFDVLRFGDDCICSFGTSLTQEQLYVLAERFKKIYILFDNEEEAQRKAEKYGRMLESIGIEVEIIDAYSEFNVNDGAELSDEQANLIKKYLKI